MPLEGVEDGVSWKWTNNLALSVEGGAAPNAVDVHPIHAKDTSSIGGNHFYGSFSLILADGTCKHHDKYKYANPTKTDHTEPQFFAWLAQELAGVGNALATAKAIIIEINQTNTPCSGQACRKAILACVAANNVCGHAFPIVIARMSAFQIYETQPPKITPTSFEIKDGKKGSAYMVVSQSMCVHKFPAQG